MYPSPLVDFGYDISDYTAIDPLYRTMADFDRLVSEAKKRNIQVIMDFVPNQDLAEACGSRTQTFNSQLTANDDVAASATV